MAFTRSFLSGLGIEPDKIAAIMETHVEVVNGLKEKINDSGEKADRIKELETELAKAKSDLKAAGEKIKEFESDDSKQKLKSLSEEFEKYKADIASKETDAKSRTALRDYLKSQGYSDEAARLIANRSDFHKSLKFGDDGKAENFADILKNIQSDEDFKGFTPKTKQEKHNPANPPANNEGKKAVTVDDIMKIKNSAERQKMIAENKELFMPSAASAEA